jgi:hypothetical protein
MAHQQLDGAQVGSPFQQVGHLRQPKVFGRRLSFAESFPVMPLG